MSTTTQPTATVRARVDRRGRISLIWLIPLITALIGGWIAWDTLSKRGPTITITFQSGEGLQAGQSRVKHKDVDLGQVTGVRLSDDASHVMVTVEMKRDAERFLTQGAKFWVVTPRLFAGSISGLDTLISGSYIELLPAAAAGPAERHFTGLEEPPVLTENVPGRTFLLHAERIGSVSVGSPVFFRGLNVGTVLGWDVGHMVRDVTIHTFVRAPYDQYVHDESRFWNASGVSVQLGAQGIKVQLDSIKALLLGGIAFDTPTPALQSPVSTAERAFTLYSDEQAANNAAYRRRIPLVGYFTGSVAGLASGSPVTFRGLRIGQVTAIDLQFDPKTNLLQTPVHFEVEPERFANFQLAAQRGALVNARFLVQHGMRAQLQSSNLLTGQMEVALAFIPDAKPAELRTEGDVIVVPTAPGQFADLSSSVNALLAKLNEMPFEQIGQNLNALLAGATALANGPEIKDAMQSLTTTLAATDTLMKQLNAGATPALRRLPEIAANLQAMLANTNKLVASTDAGYGDNSKFHRDLNRAMGQLTDMMQSLRELADLLTRHPEALIRGRTNTGMQ